MSIFSRDSFEALAESLKIQRKEEKTKISLGYPSQASNLELVVLSGEKLIHRSSL